MSLYAINYDESKVKDYTLPDPLLLNNGTPVTDRQTWIEKRRPEIIRLFETYVYGKTPTMPLPISFNMFHEAHVTVHRERGGQPIEAIRRQIRISFSEEDVADEGDYGRNEHDKATGMDLLLYIPKVKRRVPVFIGLNFWGNHTVDADPEIKITKSWVRDHERTVNNRATEDGRGMSSSRWPLDLILGRGYAVATAFYGDLDPDFDDGFQNGVHPYFNDSAQSERAPDEWATIGAWAWGLSRMLDCLNEVDEVDANKAIVFGHSRLGKTALWAAAQDERFAVAISNNSGCGGAALSRRVFGETVARINRGAPHWFCRNFKQFDGKEDGLPVDQHMLIASIAPRPVYVASATEDLWADPRGEFTSLIEANPVYRLLGREGITEEKMPDPGHSIGQSLGYHMRLGEHNITRDDWVHYIRFADRHL